MASRIVINDAALRELLTGPTGPVVEYVTDVSRKVKNEAQRRCPVDEGRLRASVEFAVTVEGDKVIGRIGTKVEYAMAVHEGTGVYGPQAAVIRPKTAKALKFMPKGGARPPGTKPSKSGFVFAAYVRGMRANPFLTDALAAVVPWPVKYRRPTGGPKG